MGVNVFAFCGIFVLILLLGLLGFLGYVMVAKNKPKIGNLVRTTFTGNPAVLTTALWGVSNPSSNSMFNPLSYASPSAYGEGYADDSVNALHCDVFGAYGTHSTWVGDGGLNYKTLSFLSSATTRYFNNKTCTQDSDCSVTQVPCGPGAPRWKDGLRNGLGVINPAGEQCPPGSSSNGVSQVYCNICKGPPDGTPGYCSYTDFGVNKLGSCVNESENNPLLCRQVSTFSTDKYCLSYNIPKESNGYVSFNRANSCSLNDDYYEICRDAPEPKPFYCSFAPGNVNCGWGQTCTANTSETYAGPPGSIGLGSGWCPPNSDWCTSTNIKTASHICSGVIHPHISMNTNWIAEGKIISTNGKTSVVQWERIANMYDGIGPSPKALSDDPAVQKVASEDLSWAYSDCRFVDDTKFNGRHASVSEALLGTSLTNPSWDPIVDVGNRDSYTSQLLYVGQSYGKIATSPILQSISYARSAWTLRSTDVPNDSLERIWFYSIFPLEPIPAIDPITVKQAVRANFGAVADLEPL